MRFMKDLGLAAVVIAALGLTACSDDDNNGGPVYLEAGVQDQGLTCGPETYPCGPYGTQKDNIAANLTFLGFWDPGALCKPHADQVIDLDNVVAISFQDWYLANEACVDEKKKLLWVNVAAGWCVPCMAEVTAIQNTMAAGDFPAEVGFLNIVFETDDRVPITEAFTKAWSTALTSNKPVKLEFPIVMDPEFKMGAYFNANATPFNMLVDTSTMKIIYRDVGADFPAIITATNEFLGYEAFKTE